MGSIQAIDCAGLNRVTVLIEVAQGLKCPLSNHEACSSNPPEPMKMPGGHGGLEARDRIPEQAG